MTPKIFVVRAAPGVSVPLPRRVFATATGVQAVLTAVAPAGRPAHPHELAGDLRLELTDPLAIAYVRGRLDAKDLIAVPPATATAAK